MKQCDVSERLTPQAGPLTNHAHATPAFTPTPGGWRCLFPTSLSVLFEPHKLMCSHPLSIRAWCIFYNPSPALYRLSLSLWESQASSHF